MAWVAAPRVGVFDKAETVGRDYHYFHSVTASRTPLLLFYTVKPRIQKSAVRLHVGKGRAIRQCEVIAASVFCTVIDVAEAPFRRTMSRAGMLGNQFVSSSLE
jgi:hypothetical protein